MSHVAEGTLMTYLDDALPVRDREAVEDHLHACSQCAFELEELRSMAREFSGALAITDAPIPMLKARAALVDRTPARRAIQLSPWRAGRSSRLLKAAAVVLLVAGGASAAIPGSPLNRLAAEIAQLASHLVFGEPEVAVPVPAPVRQVPLPTAEWGVSPADGRVRISVRGMDDGLRVTVRLVDDARVRVTAPGSQDMPAVQRAAGLLELSNVSSELVVELPRSVSRATVEINGVPYYVKNGADVRILQAATEAGDDEFIFIARS
jgi:hypothetical protein